MSLENLQVKVFNQCQNFVLVFFADEWFDLFKCDVSLLGFKAFGIEFPPYQPVRNVNVIGDVFWCCVSLKQIADRNVQIGEVVDFLAPSVEYVSLLIIAPIVLIIVNLIKFLKKKTKATNVELGNEQSQVETPDVSADIIEVIPSEELALQTPPPVTCVSDDLPQENDNNQATDNEEAASNDNSVYPTPPPIPSISEGMPQQSEANIDAGNEDDEPNDSSLIETHPSENQDCTAVGVSEGEGKENSIQEEDKFTKLYRAISPANFLEPYSPEKVKLANELLEALIKNKDNEVVISLIEEKAKEKLGVTISD